MRLIDADKVVERLHGTAFLEGDDRSIALEIIEAMPREGYEDHECNQMLNEIDFWRKQCEKYESTILKLACKLMERESV